MRTPPVGRSVQVHPIRRVYHFDPSGCEVHPVRVNRGPAARGTFAGVVLLSGMMRASMFSGDPRYVNEWFAGRQHGRWVTQNARTGSSAPPSERPRTGRPADPAAAARGLDELEQRGVITAAEAQHLRGRLGV